MITTSLITKMFFLCVAGFLASFVDSIAGGGGIISVPAFLAAGVPAHLALGTNKFCSTTASFTSSLKFAKSKKVNFNLLKYLIPFTFLGAVLGVNTVLKVDESFLQTLVLILVLSVGVYSVFSKSLGMENKFKKATKLNVCLGIILAFSLGFYDGFFGPGTGSFLIFGLIKIFGFDFVQAAGNAKFLNFISNIASLILFAIHGEIYYALGIPMIIFMILGARLGTSLAINKGSKLIKPIFITMSLLVAGKLVITNFI
ncbi:TSUP family transporter [Clostridium aestuarii]|uniref:Probable membrane transporter protein n=1 Tax=Clostridium aestuarii TaxID=338193 RepID=A0ABT4D1I1_9CLOT|nr:TSUP family transporter [Clostridium aestuarii]MCY6485104.1 TSUP family transporter [Clostridium aestuarii]